MSPTTGSYPRFMAAVNARGYKTPIDHHGPDQEGLGQPGFSIHQGGGEAGGGAVPALSGDAAAEPAQSSPPAHTTRSHGAERPCHRN
jgi:hypothetical protein